MIYRSITRMGGFLFVVVIAILAIVARLTYVQLIDGKVYAAAARANQVRLIPVAAPRGLILDRHDQIMVRSRPSFVVALIPSQIKDIKSTIGALSSTLQIPPEQLWHRLYHHHDVNYENFAQVQTYEPYGPVILASDLHTSQMARLAETQPGLPGVDLEEQPVRNYPCGKIGAHVFGYVGAITEAEYAKRKSEHYSPNDVVGKDGLEHTYDAWLRGKPGGQQVEVNAWGAVVGDERFVKSKPGNVLVTTLDRRLQEIAQRELASGLKLGENTRRATARRRCRGPRSLHRRRAGDGIVADLRSQRLRDADQRPTNSRTTSTTRCSRSTTARSARRRRPDRRSRWSPARARSRRGVIKPHQVLYDSGAWDCHGVHFGDIAAGGLGNAEFVKALAASSDGYFYQLGDRLGHAAAALLRAAVRAWVARSGSICPASTRATGRPRNGRAKSTARLPPRAERRLPARDRAGRDASDAVADRRRRWRPSSTAGRSTARTSCQRSATRRQDRQDVRQRGHPASHRDRESRCTRSRQGMDQVTSPSGPPTVWRSPGCPSAAKPAPRRPTSAERTATRPGSSATPRADHPKLAMAVYMERPAGTAQTSRARSPSTSSPTYFHKKI